MAAPAKPATPTGTVGHAMITLAWTANAEEDMDHYEVHRAAGGAYAKIGEAASNAYVDDTPVPGTAYTYQVYAVNDADETSEASDASAGLTAWPAYILLNRAITLNGTTQYATVPQAIATAIQDEGAWSGWVRFGFLPAEAATRSIFGVDVGTSSIYGIRLSSGNVIRLLNNGRLKDFVVTGLWASGQWMHLHFQWKKSTDTLQIFINGVEITAVATGTWGAQAVSSVMGLFASEAGVNKVNGALGRIGIWNRLLTAPEIALLQSLLPFYAAPAGRIFEWAPGGSVQNLMDAASVVTLVGSPLTTAGPAIFGARRRHLTLMGV